MLGRLVVENLGEGLEAESDPLGNGVFLTGHAAQSHSRLVFGLGTIPELERFTLCHRYEPFWMKPLAGERLSEVPSETQWFLGRLASRDDTGARWLLVAPLYDALFRFSLRAASASAGPEGKREYLELLGESGDPFTVGDGGLCAYLAAGADPFELCERGAASVAARLGAGRLRRDKPLPDFCDHLGWCTWDAFYQDVSLPKVRQGLESFRTGGIEPRWMILDDGWQSERLTEAGEHRLTSFAPNEKFPGGLAPLTRLTKEEFAIRWFLVWHTITGYWGGADAACFPDYSVSEQPRRFGEGILEHRPRSNEQWWGTLVGLPSTERAASFFADYHAGLREQGVDGVKVDSQSMLEGLASGRGGRVRLTSAYREALESSTTTHFGGRLINCMGNGQETWYGSRYSTLNRSSIDFFPTEAQSHGAHLYTNAQVSTWFGHFMQPDWDMFQSGHVWGSFHAAARAVSGGPVYVSDKPGTHDFSLLAKLACTDGTVLRCDQPGVPTLSCLCHDPTQEAVLLQLVNRNGNSAILGLFNCQTRETGTPSRTKSISTCCGAHPVARTASAQTARLMPHPRCLRSTNTTRASSDV